MPLDLAIGFSRTNSFVSKAMQWFMRSPISHTFIIVTLNDRVKFTIGVDERGLHWQSWNLFKSKSDIVAVFIPAGPPVEDSFWWAMDKYGDTNYDYYAAGAIGFRNRISWIWKCVSKLWRGRLSSKNLTCMELVTRMLQRAKYPSVMNKDPEMFDTHELMMTMLGNKEEYRADFVSKVLDNTPYKKICS